MSILTQSIFFNKITILVFATLTLSFHVSQYKYTALKADGNSITVSANMTYIPLSNNK